MLRFMGSQRVGQDYVTELNRYCSPGLILEWLLIALPRQTYYCASQILRSLQAKGL